MSLIAAFAAVALSGPQPDTAEAKAPVRCRPAPYLVAEVDLEPAPEKVLVTGSRIPKRIAERKGRPCYLTKDGKAVVAPTAVA